MSEGRSPGRALALLGLALCVALAEGTGGAATAPLLPAERSASWPAADQELHFAGSLAIAASIRVEGQSAATAFWCTAGVGVLKEAYDATLKPRRKGRGFSWKDLAADLAGAAAGVLILEALDR